jgi:hypothetical protein
MKNILKHDFTFAIILAFLATAAITYEVLQNPKVSVKYDCRVLIGGWHPDVPVEVQQECRKLMSKNI